MTGPSAIRRRQMVERLRASGITDERVLAAMGEVPRERFVPSELTGLAYEEQPLPIGAGQTVSAPAIVARMTAALTLTGGEQVLEVGTGNGYAAAVLARCGAHVVTVEYHDELARTARRCLTAARIPGVEVRSGDGSAGVPDRAPYDAVSVTAMAPEVPRALSEQLVDGGVLVAPIGPDRDGVLVRRRDGRDEPLGAVRFVRMRGVADGVRVAS